jgi:hypothetical protein
MRPDAGTVAGATRSFAHAERSQRPRLKRGRFSSSDRFTCPIVGCPGHHNPNTSTVRTARRGVTLRCGHCRLAWTMTWHQLARAFRRLDHQQGSHWIDWNRWATGFEDLAARAPETRGRPRTPQPPSDTETA